MAEVVNVSEFLHNLRETKPPWECPICQKVYKSYSGMEYHMLNFDHTAQTPVQKPASAIARKSKLKSSKKKKNNRFSRRSPSPIQFNTPARETLTWAEAQKMVEVESEGKIFRLNISDKLDIISDSDVDKDDDSTTSGSDNAENKSDNGSTTGSKASKSDGSKNGTSTAGKSGINSKDLKNVTIPQYNSENLQSAQPNRSSPAKLPKPTYRVLSEYETEQPDAPTRGSAYYRYIEKQVEDLEEEVEYDMDEEDAVWLELMNEQREKDGIPQISHDQLELLMDRFEKESYFEQAKNGSGSQGTQPMIDEDAVCCVCNDGECQNSNVILFCDMCNLAVHQECYGVPYIPEGQWLCRRCLQSPSCPVDCCLCPSRSGAFKQTDDNRWAHVVCALWVPEVGFSNTVFLEPIDGLKNIPTARWRLTCYICKQRNVGACIQCHRANCYTAFHVTCAQQAGLYMKMEPVRESGRNGMTITVKKEAYCDVHTPPDASPRQNRPNGPFAFESDLKKSGDKMKKARKILAEKRHEMPHIAIPYIPRDKISSIGRHVMIQKKSAFLQRLLSYWTLKRQSRNGVPLLRRLQSHVHSHKSKDPEAESQQHVLIEQLKYWHRLRHDLERARLLIELIRKREKLKRETVRISQVASELRLAPFLTLLRRALSRLRGIDVAKVFAEPVTAKEAPDYFKIIKNPMDFSTMGSKLETHKYQSFEQFESDFNLVVSNCMLYNTRETIFYRLAVRMRDYGGAVLRETRREMERTGFDPDTGMLLDKTPTKLPRQVSIDEETRLQLPLEEQLDLMIQRLDSALLNGRKTRKIRQEINNIRRKMSADNGPKPRPQTEKKRNELVTAQRRFSADDVDTVSSTTETEAVTSDVGAAFKASPKARFNAPGRRGRGRKRLWSARSPSNCDSRLKKLRLARSGSCPAPVDEQVNGVTAAQRLCEELNIDVKGDAEPTSARVSPEPGSYESSNGSGSVSRRTAVLFKKKSRSRQPSVSVRNSNGRSGVESNGSASESNTKVTAKSLKRRRSTSGHVIPEKRKHSSLGAEEKDIVFNGIDTTQDDCAFKDRPVLKRRESFHVYREGQTGVRTRSTSDSDTTSSGASVNGTLKRKKRSPKKKRSQSCGDVLVRPSVSDGTSETSNDDRPGLILDGAGEHFRKQSCASATEDEFEEDDLPHIDFLDLVWAKCRGYPPYPALLINPKMPRNGCLHNGVPIPVPPLDVLQVGDKRVENGNRRLYLVLFFDTKRTWQWLPRNKLEALGVDEKADQGKLGEGRRPAIRKNVEAAYNRALLHRSRVTGQIPDSDDDIEDTDLLDLANIPVST
uniref:Peregrin-like n=1 Tax=Phallusia mammillata TaxID=59560 RepID=A0A6F9D8D8_9ASCI|nr:peregrin-like [Phallusia mammillata]